MARTTPGSATCIECGYSLRGLVRGGTCPECGRGIEESILRSFAPSPWWGRVARGYVFIALGILIVAGPMWFLWISGGRVEHYSKHVAIAWIVTGMALSLTPAGRYRMVWIAWVVLAIALSCRPTY